MEISPEPKQSSRKNKSLNYEFGLVEFVQKLMDSTLSLEEKLTPILKISHVSHVYIYENYYDSIKGLCMRKVVDVSGPKIPPRKIFKTKFNIPYSSITSIFYDNLSQNKYFGGSISEIPDKGKYLLQNEGILSLIIMPIYVQQEWWGFIGFDHTLQEYKWNSDEIKFIETVANLLGLFFDLEEKERKYQTLLHNLPSMAFRCKNNENWTMMFLSNRCLELTGYNPEDLLNDFKLSYADLIYSKDRQLVGQAVQDSLKNHEEYMIEYRIITREGHIKWVTERGIGIYDRFGNVTALEGIILDTTTQKKMLEELIQSQKLESIGLLAGGIAHDFNNYLTSILGNIELLKIENDPKIRDEMLEDLTQATNNAKSLTNQLLVFSKGGKPIKQTYLFLDLVEEAISLIKRGSNCIFNLNPPSTKLYVTIDRAQIIQVIDNILINAVQSMPNGGDILLSLDLVDIKDVPTILPLNSTYCKLSIRDSGVGIPDSKKSMIFTPYFTTKKSGSGLGLATSYSIIRNHDGLITFDSKVGHGSLFNIYLPISQLDDHMNSIYEKNNNIEEEFHQFNGNVLVMDDNSMNLKIFKMMLEKLGYTVDLALNHEEAVKKYREFMRLTPYKFVILDLIIPGGKGGKETLQELLQLDPNVKAIVSSGYSTDAIMANYKEFGFLYVLPKPFHFDDLKKAVNIVQKNIKN